MAKIIRFPRSAELAGVDEGMTVRESRTATYLVNFADSMDALVQESLTDSGAPPREIAAVMAHRLGTLIRFVGSHYGEDTDKLTEVCTEVLQKQSQGPKDLDHVSD